MIIILDVNLVSEKSFTINTNSFELYSILSESDSLSKLVTTNILINGNLSLVYDSDREIQTRG